ncbi:MAG: glycoside hydrolase family 2 protein [Chitinophagaceae bacterium]|nr:glycoside hydrolase family 2 protein [Chitinophagaceae bacterium]
MYKKIISFFLVITVVSEAGAQVRWPAVTKTMKPWTRWWWEGSAVNKKDLTWNLEQYQKAGLGGVEITPIYGIYGYEKQFINFLSPQWMQMLVHTLNESKRLGIGVDLANATGWPFGGPWTTEADASKSVQYKIYTVNGGEKLKEPVEYKWEAWVRTANNKPAGIDTILRPVYTNKNLQALALDQIQYPGKLPLITLVAYSEGKTIDLTPNVDAAGNLNWTAPSGTWTLYALFENLHGKMVERAAPGGEGYAIDHFSATAAKNYFKKFDEAFKGYDLSYLRGFFNDSYEVDDARGQANWTTGFFAEFRKRKGYDLKEHLPALFGKDVADKNSRVIYDYRSVIDELILENFTKEWKKWGASKGKILRNQSHGSPANTLDLYSVVDIPETEGNDILRFKFATSAANVTGKKLVSSESATWLNEHFLSSWGDVKKAIDLYFLGGVNHIFYHGTEYSPKEAPWPGWLFYAAVHFQPTNPQWKDFHALNTYITRTQSFLQQGKPDNDVLLYYPLADRYSEPGNALLQHFDGMERNFERTEFEHVSKWMLEKGYSFDFFSDRQLQNFTVSGNKIISGSNTYKTILLPANKLLPVASLKKITELVRRGATVVFYKNAPADIPGLAGLQEQRKLFTDLMEQLKFTADDQVPGTSLVMAKAGAGVIYQGDDLTLLLERAYVGKEKMADKGLQFIKRKNADGSIIYFITNTSGKAVNDWIPVKVEATNIALFNPMTGKSGIAKQRKPSWLEPLEVWVQLEPYESVILQCYKQKKAGTAYPYFEAAGDKTEIAGDWTIEFLNGGPMLPAKTSITKLGLWTELAGEEVKNFSGMAKYTVSFAKPAGMPGSWILDLGKVNETAEVILNGKKIATLIGPSFQCIIAASAFQANNKLEIIVANLMANRIAYMDKNNLPWKIFYNTNMPARRRENVKNGLFDASAWAPLPSGLSGPVTLTPLK